MSATDRAVRDADLRAAVARSLRRRYAVETLFRVLGAGAIGFALLCLAILLVSIVYKASDAFRLTYVDLDVELAPAILEIGPSSSEAEVRGANYRAAIRESLKARFPEDTSRRQVRAMMSLLSPGAEGQLREALLEDHGLIGQTRTFSLLASADVDIQHRRFAETGEDFGRMSEDQLRMLDVLIAEGRMSTAFNLHFFTRGDSRYPEMAGILGALMGSLLALLVVAALSIPVGVCAAVYLEEFAPRTRWTDIIEANINNLAAVPSIIFGLLGLAIFLNVMGLPRSSPLVGGLVLTLMTLPTVIISSRAAIKAVPVPIREAALAMGASKTQMVFHHVVPSAMPGILTGSIIGMAQALGETAPLLMIGMVAFVIDVPGGILDPATTLPVQIFLWADSPERAFVERTSAAIVVLLAFLLMMNVSAVILRRKLERRW